MSLDDMNILSLAESTLSQRDPMARSDLIEKLLGQGIASASDLADCPREALVYKLSRNENFSLREAGDATKMYDTIVSLKQTANGVSGASVGTPLPIGAPPIGAPIGASLPRNASSSTRASSSTAPRPRSRSRGEKKSRRGSGVGRVKKEMDSETEDSGTDGVSDDGDGNAGGTSHGRRQGGRNKEARGPHGGKRRERQANGKGKGKSNGKDRNKRADNRPKPLLWKAVEEGDQVQVRTLLDDGRDPEEKFKGWTPLMKASEEGHVEIITMLVDIGVDLEAVNNKGRTALSFAAAPSMKRPTKLGGLRLLLVRGADVAKRDDDGKTAEDRAQKEDRWEALRVFEDHRRGTLRT